MINPPVGWATGYRRGTHSKLWGTDYANGVTETATRHGHAAGPGPPLKR